VIVKNSLNIGLIGTGFMGKAHAFAYRSALAAFPDIPVPVMKMIADANLESATKAAHQYGFEKATGNWRDLVNDPEIDVVSITTPNTLHKEMALAAIAAGKHVHCEKPLSPALIDSEAMMRAAEAAGIVTQVGFNYIKNPMLLKSTNPDLAAQFDAIIKQRMPGLLKPVNVANALP
jgi:predicted dehydrogenase